MTNQNKLDFLNDEYDLNPETEEKLSVVESNDTPFLDKYTENLNQKILEKGIENYKVIGRIKEIDDIIISLKRKNKNNPLLIGEAGVGKTAVVEGLTVYIINKTVPKDLVGKNVHSLELSSLMGAGDDQFIYRFRQIVDELKKQKDKLLFIDEIHTIVGAGSNNNFLDVSNIIKPALARGEIQIIGATTIDEYRESIETDKALERRFHEILIDEPSESEAVEILKGISPNYEKFHQVKITDEAIKTAVNFSIKFIPALYLPDKAIDLLDITCTRIGAINNGKSDVEVTEKDIAITVKEKTGIPINNILKTNNKRLIFIDEILRKNVRGQNEPINEVINAIAVNEAGLQDESKPTSLIFLGVSGVGKTALSKSISEGMFGSSEALLRLDCSEFQEKSSYLDLIGTQKSKGILTERVKHQPYSLILFDEIEKGHRSVHDILLQVLDAGRLTDGTGRIINFKNSLIIMTSNVGADYIKNQFSLKGNNMSKQERRQFNDGMQNELEKVFRPEFINRIEHKILFNVLDKKVIKEITKKYLEEVEVRLEKIDCKMKYTEEVLDFISENGTDINNGARPLEKFIKNYVISQISKIYLENNEPLQFNLTMSDNKPKRTGNGELDRFDERKILFSFKRLYK